MKNLMIVSVAMVVAIFINMFNSYFQYVAIGLLVYIALELEDLIDLLRKKDRNENKT